MATRRPARNQRKDTNASRVQPSKVLEQRFWVYVWTIKLIVLILIFIILFLFVRQVMVR